MALEPGTQLGTYEILALIGAGGMGEVYKARDHKLDRLVAIKVLPSSLASDPALLARFDREAKAVAALSHPNVLGIFDLATQDGLTYAVMELLEGESLRERLKGGALPPKRALEIAKELAQGLGAAHERGIVHRDVKPENIFITEDGRVKVLDFGLAKQVAEPRRGMANLETEAISRTPNGTEAGTVLGTAGYMSPEQVKGEPADHRSDIFSFGVVLYELLCGQRPFRGETSVQTMSAILDQDPPALAAARGPLPPALDRLVAHCLEKNPKARFQSMADLAYDLQNLSTVSSGVQLRRRPAGRSLASLLAAALGLVVLVEGGLGLAGRLHFGPATRLPSFTRVTNVPGTIETAFFGPDGRTIYFSERLKGGQPEVFVLHPGDPEPASLGLRDALLLGVSATGDLALLSQPRFYLGEIYRGTLAQAGPAGGSLKEVREGVLSAAWSGAGMVTVNDENLAKVTLELDGKVLEEGVDTLVTLRFPRMAPDGDTLALVESINGITRIVTFDRAGKEKPLIDKIEDSRGGTITGLAWGLDQALWYSEVSGNQTTVWRLGLDRSQRMLWRAQGSQALMDVSREGRMLLVDQQARRGVWVHRQGTAGDQELCIASGTQAMGMSADGRRMVLLESPIQDGGTAFDKAYLWTRDGGAPSRIGGYSPVGISLDGRWAGVGAVALAVKDLEPDMAAALRQAGVDLKAFLDPNELWSPLILLPMGPGRPQILKPAPNLVGAGNAQLSPDDRQVAFIAADQGVLRWYLMDRESGRTRPLTPPGTGVGSSGLYPFSPDGSRFIFTQNAGRMIQPVAGGEPVPVQGYRNGERILGFTRDQKDLIVHTTTLPLEFLRLDPVTGQRRPLFSYMPGEPTGLLRIRSVCTTPDADVVAINYVRQLSSLYLVDGLT